MDAAISMWFDAIQCFNVSDASSPVFDIAKARIPHQTTFIAMPHLPSESGD